MADRYLSVAEAAGYLRVSTFYLNKLRCLGGGPRYIKFGRRILYDRQDLDQWLEARKRQSTSESNGSDSRGRPADAE